MKVYKVYSHIFKNLYGAEQDEIACFDNEKDAKAYCDILNAINKKYAYTEYSYKFDYMEIDIDRTPIVEYLYIKVDVVYAKGMYKGEGGTFNKFGYEFKEDGYVRIDKNWLIKIISKEVAVLSNGPHIDSSSLFYEKMKTIRDRKSKILYRYIQKNVSSAIFGFPMFLKEHESADEFNNRCYDTAIKLFKEEPHKEMYMPIMRLNRGPLSNKEASIMGMNI